MSQQVDAHELARRVAANVRALRGELKWSQEELAQQCDLSHRVVQYAESAAGVPKLSTLCSLAKGLGRDVRDLLAPTRRNATPAPHARKPGRPRKR